LEPGGTSTPVSARFAAMKSRLSMTTAVSSRRRVELVRCRAGESAALELEARDDKGHLRLPADRSGRPGRKVANGLALPTNRVGISAAAVDSLKWVMGYRCGDVGGTTDVPQTAAGPPQSAGRQGRART
jgi:hypothetical protein